MPKKGTRWVKSPEHLVSRFRFVLDDFPDLEQRGMFGFPAAFAASGHLVSGLNGSDWIVRLGETDQVALSELGGRVFKPVGGRPMTGFFALPQEVVSDDAEVRRWVGRARAYVATLPPKPRKTAKAS